MGNSNVLCIKCLFYYILTSFIISTGLTGKHEEKRLICRKKEDKNCFEYILIIFLMLSQRLIHAVRRDHSGTTHTYHIKDTFQIAFG